MPDSFLEAARKHLREMGRRHLGKDIAAADIEVLIDHASPLSLAPGDVLFRQNDPASSALLLVEGRLRASLRAGGNEQVVGDSLPGEIVGEAALFRRGGRRTVTLTAVEPSSCLVLNRAVLVAAAGNPALVALEMHLAVLSVERLAGRVRIVREAWEACEGVQAKLAAALAARGGAA